MSARKLSAVLMMVVTAAVTIAIFLLAMNAGRADHAPYYRPDRVVVYGD